MLGLFLPSPLNADPTRDSNPTEDRGEVAITLVCKSVQRTRASLQQILSKSEGRTPGAFAEGITTSPVQGSTGGDTRVYSRTKSGPMSAAPSLGMMRTVFCISGPASASAYWSNIVDIFAESFRAFSKDVAAFGKSAKVLHTSLNTPTISRASRGYVNNMQDSPEISLRSKPGKMLISSKAADTESNSDVQSSFALSEASVARVRIGSERSSARSR